MRPSTLETFGQSIWLDSLHRRLLASGELVRMVREYGVRGVTANPPALERAIASTHEYEEDLHALIRERDRDAIALYESISLEDVRQAADSLRSVFEASNGLDGYACLAISPYLAHETEAMVREARQLWQQLRHDNTMIKIPATAEGIPAVGQLISEGIPVNVTLIFGERVYRQVVDAYLTGLEARAARGQPLASVMSLASLSVKPLDALLDPLLEERAESLAPARQGELRALIGRVGVASAKLIYQVYRELCHDPRCVHLVKQGARPQRLLFSGNGPRDPRVADLFYVEELIGPETVTSMSLETLQSFREHGRARASLEEDQDRAAEVLNALEDLGFSLDRICERLQEEGLAEHTLAFDRLMAVLAHRRSHLLGTHLNRWRPHLADPLAGTISATLADWRMEARVRRLWSRDATLWTGRDEGRQLEWLASPDQQLAHIEELQGFAEEVKRGEFTQVVLLGMGGAVLSTEALARTLASGNAPRLLVLDSTDPAQIRACEAAIDMNHTLFVVASKSGETSEPVLLDNYFFEQMAHRMGAEAAAQHFVMVTDPGSPLEDQARQRHYRQVFLCEPEIAGRYSALATLGMVPAAAAQIDIRQVLLQAAAMKHSCAASVPPEQNPGILLGVTLATAAAQGRDKITIIASPGLQRLGAWIEQVLAGSTGKHGRGLIPIEGEPLGTPAAYGADRLFIYLRLDKGSDPVQDAAVEALSLAGQPIVHIEVDDVRNIGQELYRWEVGAAVAASAMTVNPFDQPDVEASKLETKALTDSYQASGRVHEQIFFLREGAIGLFADERNRAVLERGLLGERNVRNYLHAHLARLTAGDYCGLLAWVERSGPNERRLEVIRRLIRDDRRVATSVGFGPRFLHSMGQAYKGGPATGVFLHILGGDEQEVAIPGRDLSFAVTKRIQANSEFRVLCHRGRRLLGIHIGKDHTAGLEAIVDAIRSAPPKPRF